MSQVTRTELVSTLFKKGDVILPTLTPEKINLLHAAIGIAGEAGEIMDSSSEFNMLQELGDARFYLEALLQGLGADETEVRTYSPATSAGHMPAFPPQDRARYRISVVSSNILDLVKKHTIADGELKRDAILQQCHMLLIAIEALYNYEGISDEEVHRENFNKLSDRYKGLVYSDDASRARADENHDQ